MCPLAKTIGMMKVIATWQECFCSCADLATRFVYHCDGATCHVIMKTWDRNRTNCLETWILPVRVVQNLNKRLLCSNSPLLERVFDQIMLQGCRCCRNFGVIYIYIYSLQGTSNGCFSLRTAGSCLYMRKIICQKLELTDSFWSLPRTSHSLSRWVSTKPLRKWWQSWLVSTRHGRNTLVFQSIKSLLRCFAVHDYSQLAPCHSRWAGTPSTLPWRSLWHLSLPFMIPFWFNVCICGPAHPAHGRCKQSKLLWQDIGRTHVSQGPSYIHWAKKVEPVVVRWSPWKWQVSIVSTCHCCMGGVPWSHRCDGWLPSCYTALCQTFVEKDKRQ